MTIIIKPLRPIMSDPVKEALRQTCKSLRAQLPAEFQQQASSRICNRIKKLEVYRRAKYLALYLACKGEVSLENLWRSAPLQGKFCHFPALCGQQLIFLPATPKTPFKPNRYNILEPDVDPALAIDPEELDLIFLPLVAFDPEGNRLGMGAGYYDRTLAAISHPSLLGLAYEFQKQDRLFPESWDVGLDGVVTELNFYSPEGAKTNP